MVNEELYTQLSCQLGTGVIEQISTILGLPLQSTLVIVAVIVAFIFVWSLVWKGFALWKAARDNQKFWFVLLLVINTAGIFEILYIYYFSKKIKVKKFKDKINKKIIKKKN